MTFELLLWTYDSPDADGRYPIQLKTTHERKRKYYGKKDGLTLRATPDEWNQGVRILYHPNATAINLEILRLRSEMEKALVEKKVLQPDEIRAIIAPPKEVVTSVEATKSKYVVDYFSAYIEKCRRGEILNKKEKAQMSKGTVVNYETTLQYITQFKGDVTFDEVNKDFLSAWVNFQRTKKGVMHNTIVKRVSDLKIIMGASMDEGFHKNLLWKKFTMNYIKGEAVRLTPHEVDLIWNLDLSGDGEFEDVKYKFLLKEQQRFKVAYNFLLRFSDTIKIKEENVIFRDNLPFLSLQTSKTGAPVLIPIKEEVYQILINRKFKIRGNLDNSNIRLKKLGKMAGIKSLVQINGKRYEKWQKIGTHTTRRSAATNLYNDNFPPEDLRMIGGWASHEQMMDYIDVKLEKTASVAAQHSHFK